MQIEGIKSFSFVLYIHYIPKTLFIKESQCPQPFKVDKKQNIYLIGFDLFLGICIKPSTKTKKLKKYAYGKT